ncbi:MAG: LemA family protein [Alphaproteobacteria bacterium]|nr:LemA family protein [Alphaproteobacteria bacterium]
MLYVWLTLLAICLIFIYDYNKLIRLNQQVNEGWSGIDVQLKRRRDLIPELVKIAAFYAKHEKETFSRVTELRSHAEGAKNIEDLAVAETEITTGLQKIFAIAEAYPELKSDSQFIKLQDNLSTVEKDLSYSRRYYNAAVRNYNIAIYMFPEIIVANAMGYKERSFFEISASERENVNVKF